MRIGCLDRITCVTLLWRKQMCRFAFGSLAGWFALRLLHERFEIARLTVMCINVIKMVKCNMHICVIYAYLYVCIYIYIYIYMYNIKSLVARTCYV